MFNLHDVMLLLTAALAVVLAIPMLLRRQRRTADVTLAAFVLTQGLAALYFLFLYSPVLQPATLALLGWFWFLPLVILYALQGPLLFWYSHAISGQAVRWARSDRVVIAGVLPLALLQAAVTEALLGDLGYLWLNVLVPLPALTASVVYGFCALGVWRRHNEAIRQRYSNIDDINLLWLSYSAFGFAGVWAIRVLGYFAGMFGGGHGLAQALGIASNVPAIILIACMVTLGLSQRLSPPGRPRDDVGDGAERKPPNPELVSKLEHLMTQVKVYQDPDLDVEGLADSMGISPRGLSALINGHYGKNFYDFVNHYRVLEAQRMLRDPAAADQTIQRIFEDAGFNSKSTFNTFFKKATGKTPSEYRRMAGARSSVAA